MGIEEILQLNCNEIIPTRWNIYKWAEEHPKTAIAHSIKRIEKIMDISDSVTTGFSGGKDSTLSANLACLELNLRRLRVKNGIDRNGNSGVDPLDLKWEDRRISMSMSDAEVCFTLTNDYAKRFLKKYGPQNTFMINGEEFSGDSEIKLIKGYCNVLIAYSQMKEKGSITIVDKNEKEIVLTDERFYRIGGFDLIEFTWVCLPMSWQSGVSFNSGVLISWDPNNKDIWVQQMPTREDLFGFDCLSIDNFKTANPVPLSTLSEEAQKYHKAKGNTFECKKKDLFGNYSEKAEEIIEAVCNFGRGPMPPVSYGMHEKDFQDLQSRFLYETSWLVGNDKYPHNHDLSRNVWFLEGDKNGCITTSLISLRAEESLDRRIILIQGEYSTGQYSNNNGVNVCSPVFDFTTSDVWRLLCATNWDVNDIYQMLFEVGVAPSDQRVGSLLNYAAVRQISTVKALEPSLYGRINARFQNVEFMSQFSRAGYYKIGKPKDTRWDGKNHLKAGVSIEKMTELSDRYEHYLQLLDIPYERNGNEFISKDPKYKGKPWFPLQNYFDLIEKNKD